MPLQLASSYLGLVGNSMDFLSCSIIFSQLLSGNPTGSFARKSTMNSSIYFGADFHEAMLILEATPYKSQAHSYTPNEHSPRKMQRLGICDMLMIFSKIAQASMWTILEALSKVSSLNEFLAVLGSHGGSDSWDNKNDVFKGWSLSMPFVLLSRAHQSRWFLFFLLQNWHGQD